MGRLSEIVDVFKCCIFNWGAFTTILPAFMIAGAFSAFVPSSAMTKYLGAGSKRYLSYPIAAISGAVLPACSCNIVPLFAGILDRGAGIGPAFTFLYAGPAINIVSAALTFKVIGPLVGIWRIIGTLGISIALGLAMERIFPAVNKLRAIQKAAQSGEKVDKARLAILFFLLLGVLMSGSWLTSPDTASAVRNVPIAAKAAVFAAFIASLAAFTFLRFRGYELADWAKQTFRLMKIIIPIFLISIVAIGFIAKFVDVRWIQSLFAVKRDFFGNRLFASTLSSTFYAAIFGELMYFPILSDIAFVKAFLKLGLDIGPVMAILLAGPGTSLPGFILISRFVSWKKVAAYFTLSLVLEVIFAVSVAMVIGDYICACMNLK